MITGQRTQKLKAELTNDSHTITSDVLPSLGGDDTGLNPHELIEAGLTACTIITCQMYADRQGWKLESTDVVAKIVSEGAQSEISLKVNFRGDLTAEQRIRLLDVSKRCPIHKLLESTIKIRTSN